MTNYQKAITLDFSQIGESAQAKIKHKLAFKAPTKRAGCSTRTNEKRQPEWLPFLCRCSQFVPTALPKRGRDMVKPFKNSSLDGADEETRTLTACAAGT